MTYNGLYLGWVSEPSVYRLPKARQVNSYPGVNGNEVLDLGSRGGGATVSGTLTGNGVAGLEAYQGLFYSLQDDGGGYPLVTDAGNVWPGVILVMFRPVGPRFVTNDGTAIQRYEAEFFFPD